MAEQLIREEEAERRKALEEEKRRKQRSEDAARRAKVLAVVPFRSGKPKVSTSSLRALHW